MEGQNFRARNQIGKQLARAGLTQAAAQLFWVIKVVNSQLKS